MPNTILHPSLTVKTFLVNDETQQLHMEVILPPTISALKSRLITLDVSKGLDDDYSGFLFVELQGIPGIEEVEDSDGELFRVPKGTIPHDEEHNGLLYRTIPPHADTWDLLPEDADTDKYDYIDYEGAEDSLAGFFNYADTDFDSALDCLAAQIKVLNDWVESQLAK